MISVLIPVYKEPKCLEDILSKLTKNKFEEKEIIVVVDGETSESIKEVIDKFSENIKVIENGTRKGKVNSLNDAVNFASGEILLFLDNDVEIPEDMHFLNKINKAMKRYDIIEIPKEGKAKSLFGKIVSYDYLVGAIASLTITKILGKNLFLCGSAFAIKKETFINLGKFSRVINEDWDLALKSLNKDIKFGYPTNIKVKTLVPENISDWVNQRKKWTLGMKYWWNTILLNITNYLKHLPLILLVGIVLFISGIVGGLIWLLLSLPEIQLTLFGVISHLGIPLGITSFVSSYLVITSLLRGLASFATAVFINLVVFFIFSRVFNFRFNILEVLVYSIIYYPFVVVFYLIYGVMISNIVKPKLDWVY